MTERCDLCPRTPVTHVPSLYSFKLGHPAIPLDVLEQVVDEWLMSKK